MKMIIHSMITGGVEVKMTTVGITEEAAEMIEIEKTMDVMIGMISMIREMIEGIEMAIATKVTEIEIVTGIGTEIETGIGEEAGVEIRIMIGTGTGIRTAIREIGHHATEIDRGRGGIETEIGTLTEAESTIGQIDTVMAIGAVTTRETAASHTNIARNQALAPVDIMIILRISA